jgi:hypothetical protein
MGGLRLALGLTAGQDLLDLGDVSQAALAGGPAEAEPCADSDLR